MADIINPQAVRFANEAVRVMCDELVTAYDSARAFKEEWDANSMAAVIPNTADLIADGSATDGRAPITGAQANGLKTQIDALLTWFETGSPSRITAFRRVAVNGRNMLNG